MQTGIDVMCQNVPVYVCVARQKCMSAMHPSHSQCAVSVRGELTLMGVNWMETASVQSEASSLWLKSFWSSLLLSLSFSWLVCLCLCRLFSTAQKQMSGRRYGTWQTHLFVFWVFSISLTRSTTPPPPLPYPPTHPHACMLTPTHYLSVSCILSLSHNKTGHGGTPGASVSGKLQWEWD